MVRDIIPSNKIEQLLMYAICFKVWAASMRYSDKVAIYCFIKMINNLENLST